MRITSVVVALLLIGTHMPVVHAQDLADEVAELRALLTEVQQDYEARISDLEIRLAKAEQLASGAKREATEAFDIAEQTAIDQSRHWVLFCPDCIRIMMASNSVKPR